jgi:hypothetical protein
MQRKPTMNAAEQVAMIRGVERLEEIAARPSADVAWALDRVARSNHLDRGELAKYLLVKLIAVFHARKAVAAYDQDVFE